MGLCKCPKRKVTNLFCFEHRVNVCESCLVTNHSKCIVKSYLQWLQDSDYSPICTLCQRNLNDEDCGECVRLTCYDVFHWRCLNQYAQQLPAQTAPAGYVCPLCSACIFPQPNLVSPVADALRGFLQQVNWARAGLGLPLIEETAAPSPSPLPPQSSTPPSQVNGAAVEMSSQSSLKQDTSFGSTSTAVPSNSSPTSGHFGMRPSAQVAPYPASPQLNNGGPRAGGQHSVISVDEGTSARGLFSNPRKLFDTTKEDDFFASQTKSHDHDEDKYKRRPALQWLARWFNSRDGSKRKDPQAVKKRFAVILLLGIIGFITICIIFAKLGRQSTEDDPFFDPLANPNIKVQHNVESVP